jgi:Flp pilus assembly protein TadD
MSGGKSDVSSEDMYNEACRLVSGLLIESSDPAPPLEAADTAKMQEAYVLFSAVATVEPKHWPSQWAMGKICERLGDDHAAMRHFLVAATINSDHPDLFREACIAATKSGELELARTLGERATLLSPNDVGLKTNLAIAILLMQRTGEARRVATEALTIDSSDKRARLICHIVDQVEQGVRACPQTVYDL